MVTSSVVQAQARESGLEECKSPCAQSLVRAAFLKENTTDPERTEGM